MSVLTGAVALVALVARLYWLQVIEGERHRQLSTANFIDVRRQVPLRGMIFDRNKVLLADNRPSFNVYLTPAFCPEEELSDTLQKLATVLGLSRLDVESLSDAYRAASRLERFVPILVRRDIAWEELAALEQQMDKLPGVEVRPETRRYYPHGKLAAHLLGYVGETSMAELERLKHKGYRRGDFIGKYGIEQAYEQQLRGRPGTVTVVVDSRKQPVPSSVVEQLFKHLPNPRPARPGNNLVLSIDARLQQRAERRFPGFEGAVVALEPQTGFLLALVSKPAFDPNLLSRGISARQWEELVTDPYKPLTNRATQQHYPPGSTFKPFTALAALQKGAIGERTRLLCTGAWVFGGRPFRCWRAAGHGNVDLHRAIVQSCDVFFYRAGYMAGQDAIADIAHRFGFGSLPHLDCGPEVPGLVPDTDWYRRHTKTGYLPGFVLSNAIGQGDVNVTPIQLALAYAALANGGTLYKPQVVLRIERPDGTVVERFSPVVKGKVGVEPSHLEAVRQGLIGVVNEPGGTAWWRRPRNVDFKVAGKTGTAQVVVQGQERGKDLPYDLKDHAWFVGWAPVDDPRIVVAVVNEHGGHGSSGAAPLVMELITYYLESLAGMGEEKPS
ncbi:MAG: penicillin-binding protein 2 [Deltaproteobacteria bacterium]|nr:MAG: penicillin-binding protein 2 [Deltaproteobacteria bacterium]